MPSAVNTYNIGDLVLLSAAFSDHDGNPADPDTVSLKVRRGKEAASDFTPTRDAPGQYSYRYSLAGASPGVYSYRFAGVGTVQAAGERQFQVAKSLVL
jgi:hypothetical protein